MKRVALTLLALWVARWAARELASVGANRWLGYRPQDFEAPHAPGHMPAPGD